MSAVIVANFDLLVPPVLSCSFCSVVKRKFSPQIKRNKNEQDEQEPTSGPGFLMSTQPSQNYTDNVTKKAVTEMKKIGATILTTIAAVLVLSAVDAKAQNLTCTGTIGAVFADTVNVPIGAVCTLLGTQIRGDIKVAQGARLDARNVRVNGSIQAELSDRVVVRSGSRVNGSIQIKKGNLATISRSTVLGDVQLEENSGTLTVNFSSVTGELSASKNSGAINFLSNTNVGVDIVAEENAQKITITNNRTNGNIQISKNSAGIVVTNNFARGNLQCVENRPFQTQSGNSVGGNLECSNF